MDKKEALEEEITRHKEIIESIELADTIAKKIKSLLPKGWSSRYGNFLNRLYISSGDLEKSDNKKPSEEFKLVCKILSKLCDFDGTREANADEETNTIIALEAKYYFRLKEHNATLTVAVTQYHPEHKCEIEWREETYVIARVSDDCLGLGGGK